MGRLRDPFDTVRRGGRPTLSLRAGAMASIERTAYPRFRRMVTARELVGLSPTVDEITWAREQTRSESHLLALVLSLKCFQRLGYFPTLEEIPEVVLLHVRRCLGLKEDVGPTRGERTATTQRVLVRRRVGVTYDPERALAIAADAIRTAAAVNYVIETLATPPE